MNVLCLHGLVPQGAPRPDTDRLPQHDRLALGELTALISGAPQKLDDEEAGLTALISHDRLLAAYLAHGPILPVRFGTAFSGKTALRDALAGQVPAMARQLEYLKGLAEYAMTVTTTDAPPIPRAPENHVSGRDFLIARKARRERRSEQLALTDARVKSLEELAMSHAVAGELRPHHPSRLMSLSLLMRSGQAESLRQQIDRYCGDPLMSVRLVGPFPPYSFCNIPREEHHVPAPD